MRGLSVIIPSKTLSNVLPCMEAVRRHEPEANIIVVDDGIDRREWMPFVNMVVNGEKPFAFPRNCNIGIRAASDHDVVLLNDDAILETPGGFSLLQSECEAHPEFGLISATTNVAGNPAQFRQNVGLREEPRTVAFVCVFIPRRTFDVVGLMDERFGGLTTDGKIIYGYCDNDMCRRVRNAGLKIGIHDGCFVDHSKLQSSFRGLPRSSADISISGAIYRQKWGDLN